LSLTDTHGIRFAGNARVTDGDIVTAVNILAGKIAYGDVVAAGSGIASEEGSGTDGRVMIACGSVPECAITNSYVEGAHRQVASRRLSYRAVGISAREARECTVTEGRLEAAGAVLERIETDGSVYVRGVVVGERTLTNGSVIAASGVGKECKTPTAVLEFPRPAPSPVLLESAPLPQAVLLSPAMVFVEAHSLSPSATHETPNRQQHIVASTSPAPLSTTASIRNQTGTTLIRTRSKSLP